MAGGRVVEILGLDLNIKDLHKMFNAEILEKASYRAMTAVTRKANVVVARSVADEYNITQAVVKSKLNLQIVKRGDGTLSAYMEYVARRIQMVRFLPIAKRVSVKTRRWGDTRLGVTTKIKKKGARKLSKTGFLADSKTGAGVLIFERVIKDGKEKLFSKKTISVAEMVGSANVIRQVNSAIEDVYPIELARNIEYYARKQMGLL